MAELTEKFMREAIALAQHGMQTFQGGPFGAVIVKNNEIIGRGCNQVTSLNDPTAHAEMQAIRDACKNLKTFALNDCEIYCNSEPCPMCLSGIYWARINKIYYATTHQDAAAIGFDDHLIQAELKKSLIQQKIEAMQLLRDDALVVFRQWESFPKKVMY